MERRKRILTLHLKREWFEKIKSGEKTVEYRAVTDHWRDMLVGRTYDEIHLMLGYPSSNDADRIIRRKWNGSWPAVVTDHPQFGHGNVPVFAIDVSVKLS